MALYDNEVEKASLAEAAVGTTAPTIRKRRNDSANNKREVQAIDLHLFFLLCGEKDVYLPQNLRRLAATFWESHRHVAMNERQTKMVNMLWDGFDGKLTSSKWAKINKCSPDTALRDLQDLVAKGILVRTESGGRSTGYDLVK